MMMLVWREYCTVACLNKFQPTTNFYVRYDDRGLYQVNASSMTFLANGECLIRPFMADDFIFSKRSQLRLGLPRLLNTLCS